VSCVQPRELFATGGKSSVQNLSGGIYRSEFIGVSELIGSPGEQNRKLLIPRGN
jgi:hypothetical protein